MIEGSPRFETTHWSAILAARGDSPAASEALSRLCQVYWVPLYAFIRRWGHTPDDAADLTQSFFADILARGDLSTVDPAKGRFRTFLMTCCRNFLCKDRRRAAAHDPPPISIDLRDAERRYLAEPVDVLTPDKIYNRRWAVAALEQALQSVRDEYDRSGRGDLFCRLSPTLAGEPLPGGFAVAAEVLNMTEGALHVAAYRLRRRYREAIRRIVAETVEEPELVDDEIRDLFAALAISAAGPNL